MTGNICYYISDFDLHQEKSIARLVLMPYKIPFLNRMGDTGNISENGKNLSAASQDMDVWAVPLHIKQCSRNSPHQLVVLVA
jgi:hypothetical protein